MSIASRYLRPVPGAGVAFHRLDLPGGLDFISTTITTHEFPPHMHQGYTLGVVHRGRLECTVRGVSRVYAPGSLLLINPGEVHTERASPGGVPVCYDMILPTVELVERLTGAAPMLHPQPEHNRDLVRQLERLARLAFAPSPDGERILASVLGQFVAALGPGPDRGSSRRGHLTRLVQQFLQYNLRARPTLDNLGRSLRLHPGYLRRVFRLETGLSPRSYLVQLRVMRARQLLGKGATIAEAVAAAGFSDQAHLTHAFRRTMGFAPRQFQHQLGYR